MYNRYNQKGAYIKFEEIKKIIKEGNFVTLRSDSDELFEAVLNTSELEQLASRLVKIFGEPVYPSAKKYPFSPEKLAESYGGLMPGQTLYYLEQKESSVLAMVWPWQDRMNITFKLINSPVL